MQWLPRKAWLPCPGRCALECRLVWYALGRQRGGHEKAPSTAVAALHPSHVSTHLALRRAACWQHGRRPS
eukprot:362645-Chlamydomonas_euryale.AAC.1